MGAKDTLKRGFESRREHPSRSSGSEQAGFNIR